MKNFILTESIMNGLVTMDILTSIVRAENFENAILKIKNLDGFVGAEIATENDQMFSYSLKDCGFLVFGRMNRKEASIIE